MAAVLTVVAERAGSPLRARPAVITYIIIAKHSVGAAVVDATGDGRG